MTMPKTECGRLERAAHHEAGHAVMAYLCGHELDSVSIKETDEYSGVLILQLPKWFKPDTKKDSRHKKRINEYAMILYSGAGSEMHFAGNYGQYGAEADFETARGLASHLLTGDALEKYQYLMKLQAHEQLGEPLVWTMVEEVASKLLKRPILHGYRVEAICSRVAPKNGDLFALLEKRISERIAKVQADLTADA